MIQKLRNPGDLLFSVLNTTYRFLGETGGEKLLKDWCDFMAEHGLWSGVVDADREGGVKGVKKFWDDFLEAEGMPKTSCTTTLLNDREFLMEITHCHSQATVKEIGAQLYGEACLHCLHICQKMADMTNYKLEFKYDSKKGWCSRRWIKKDKNNGANPKKVC